MIIYIAGPMSGIQDFNRPLFNKVAIELTEQGYSALNPATLPDGLSQGQYMQICLPMVAVADELVMLPGWEQSEGASIEFMLAKKSGKTIRGICGSILFGQT
ncbi:MAG: DUF4406 domain-containing protein [Shewanella sp.]